MNRAHRTAPLALLGALAVACARESPDLVGLPPVLSVQPGSAVARPGEEVAFVASLAAHATTRDAVRWRSDDSLVFRLDTVVPPNRPVIGRARAGGRAIVTVTAGSEVFRVPVSVQCATPLLGIQIDGIGAVLVGDTLRLTATPPRDACTPSTAAPRVRWESRDPAIAAIDTTGLVTGRAPGRATITATADNAPNVVGAVTIEVRPRPTR